MPIRVFLAWNVAVQFVLAVMTTVVLLFIVTTPFVQPMPVQPANVEPLAGVAVNVTVLPLL
jgi:hypothetical protein